MVFILAFSIFWQFNSLDDTDGNSFFHVSNSKSTKWSVFFERFNAHWFGWVELDDSRVTSFDEFRILFEYFTRSSVILAFDLFEFNSDVSSVAIKNRAVTVMDFSRMTKNDNLSIEGFAFSGWGVGGV